MWTKIRFTKLQKFAWGDEVKKSDPRTYKRQGELGMLWLTRVCQVANSAVARANGVRGY